MWHNATQPSGFSSLLDGIVSFEQFWAYLNHWCHQLQQDKLITHSPSKLTNYVGNSHHRGWRFGRGKIGFNTRHAGIAWLGTMIVYDRSCALATGRAILKSTYKLTKMVWNKLVQESSLGKVWRQLAQPSESKIAPPYLSRPRAAGSGSRALGVVRPK